MTYRIGDSGMMVRQIQKALAGAGLKVIVDGYFGPITREAVQELQKKKGLTVDGIVGPATLALLIPFRIKKSKRRIDEIIVPCTATKEGVDVSVEQLRNDHMKNRGFSDIGYHYVVMRSGVVEYGRDVDIAGAHCTGHNAHSIGVVYVGGLSKLGKATDTRTNEQKAALMGLLMDLRRLYPDAKIVGHRDCSPDLNGDGTVESWEWIKVCPCFDAVREYSKI